MGLTCKPIGKFASAMRKMENKLVEEKMENRGRKERKKAKELETA